MGVLLVVMRIVCALVAIIVAIIQLSCALQRYKHDLTFPQRDLRSMGVRPTAVLVEPHATSNGPTRIHVGQRELAYPQPILVLSTNGSVIGSYGSHSIANTSSDGWGIHGMAFDGFNSALWVTDLLDHRIKQLNPNTGDIVGAIGTAGTAGSGTAPMQFGNVADISFSTPLDDTEHPETARFMFVADGDGGVDNRVSAFTNYSPDYPPSSKPSWIVGNATAGSGKAQFSSPHSITWHQTSSVVIVADRGNNRARFIQGTFDGPKVMGTPLGTWEADCVGTPWGVRIFQNKDVLFVADGTNQRLSVISTKGLTGYPGGDPPKCSVLQRIPIDKKLCELPHELAVDEATGDVYLACVGNTNGNIMRFVPV